MSTWFPNFRTTTLLTANCFWMELFRFSLICLPSIMHYTLPYTCRPQVCHSQFVPIILLRNMSHIVLYSQVYMKSKLYNNNPADNKLLAVGNTSSSRLFRPIKSDNGLLDTSCTVGTKLAKLWTFYTKMYWFLLLSALHCLYMFTDLVK